MILLHVLCHLRRSTLELGATHGCRYQQELQRKVLVNWKKRAKLQILWRKKLAIAEVRPGSHTPRKCHDDRRCKANIKVPWT